MLYSRQANPLINSANSFKPYCLVTLQAIVSNEHGTFGPVEDRYYGQKVGNPQVSYESDGTHLVVLRFVTRGRIVKYLPKMRSSIACPIFAFVSIALAADQVQWGQCKNSLLG